MKAIILATYWLTRVFYYLGTAAVVLMMLHIGLDVAARAFLGRPTYGMVETVTNYYMIAVCFLPIAYVQVKGEHLTVETFTEPLPKPVIRWITVFGLLVAMLISALLTWYSGVSAIAQTRAGEYTDINVMDFPIWPARWLLVVGYGAACVTLFLQMILEIAGKPLAELDKSHG